LHTRALPLVNPRPGASIAVLGYPEDGPFNATPGRIGRTQFVLMQNAYGSGPVNRLVTTLRGTFRHGDSGGPGVDANGDVQTMVFASRVGGGGFGVAPLPIRIALARARGPVSTGRCAP
jgi:S1-C subfamily serine protease